MGQDEGKSWYENMNWDEKLHYATGCVRTAFEALLSIGDSENVQSTLIIAANLLDEVYKELEEMKEPQPAAKQN